MGASYEIWLLKDDGTRLALLDTTAGFEWSIVLHDVGAITLELPPDQASLIVPDRRIAVWRRPEGGAWNLQRVYLCRRILDRYEGGTRIVSVTGLDGNVLLRRRIVAYAEKSTQAFQTDQADDICREIVRDNLLTDAVAARQISSSYLTVAANLGAGPSVTCEFAHRNVLTALQEVANAANVAGTDVYWDVAPVSEVAWEFRTFTGQPGLDHSFSSGIAPVFLGLEFGNLDEPALDWDYSDEVTVVYPGDGTAVEDTARSSRSLFGRSEAFQQVAGKSTDGATAAAQAALEKGRPRLRFTGSILDAPGCRLGLHWQWGDRVTAQYAGQSWDAIVKALRVTISDRGQETVEAHLECDE